MHLNRTEAERGDFRLESFRITHDGYDEVIHADVFTCGGQGLLCCHCAQLFAMLRKIIFRQ